ncbi:MAG: aspartate kinase [Oligoflexales bacterium]|nr:aspartate kinase [Oligoflexales bacterium]
MTRIQVQKYGGTSVGDLPRLERVAARIQASLESCDKVVVVVSAMGRFTDELIGMAKSIHSCPPKRELDMLVTTGERISSSLLGISLHKLGISAISLTGSQCGILTDETHGNARIRQIQGDRLKSCLESYQVVIVAGFQGVSPMTKDITSLGRGGSDLTAVALAIALQAKLCEINTDVDGVFTGDPKKVVEPKLISKLTWKEMTELSWAGAGVLHHRAAFLAEKHKLPIVIRSSQSKSDKQTLIEGNKLVEDPYVTAITSKKHQVFLEIAEAEPFPSKESISIADIARDYLWSYDESPLIFQTGYRGSCLYLVMVCSEEHAGGLLKELKRLKPQTEVKVKQESASVSIIGGGFKQNPGLVRSAYACLQKPHYFSEVKDSSITFVLAPDDLEDSLKACHELCLGR